MSLKSIKKIRALKEEQLNKIIKSAWQDRISFEEIEESLGLTEAEVITVMQRELKHSPWLHFMDLRYCIKTKRSEERL
jgi:uncharacterized protein (TIGR03643 family)